MPVGDRRSVSRASRDGTAFSQVVEFTLAGRSVMSAGFALPRDAGRRPALLSRASRDGTGAPFRAPSGMGRGGEFTLVGRSVMSAGFALPRDAGRRPAVSRASGMGCGAEFTLVGRSVMSAGSRSRAMPVGDRRSLACAPLCPVGARRNCIFTARGGVALTGAGRSVMALVSRSRAMPVGDRRSLARASRDGTAFSQQGGECTLVGRSVMSAGFALPRDAGRRPALLSRQPGWDVVGNSRWQGAAS